jgi:hypothetical protein
MEAFLNGAGETASLSAKESLRVALRTWAVSEFTAAPTEEKKEALPPTDDQLDQLLKKGMEGRVVEVALLDRTQPGSSKYRMVPEEEVRASLKGWLT